MTLKGTDGIMIMIDPAGERAAETSESIAQLRDFLSAYGVGLHETPAVLQFTSSTLEILPNADAQIAAAVDLSSLVTCRSNATTGEGVLEALTALSRQILDRVTVCGEPSETGRSSSEPAEEIALPEPLQQNGNTPRSISPVDSPPKVALLTHEVISEGGTIRIPLAIGEGSAVRRLVVTVNVNLE
jgi:hypothetical protein